MTENLSKQIKRIDELPSNFDLSKYDGLKHFTAYDWHLALGKRYALYDYIFNMSKELDDSQSVAYFLTSVNSFLDTPLLVAGENFAYHDNFPPASTYTGFNHYCINSASVSDEEPITFCDVVNLDNKDILNIHVYDYIKEKAGDNEVCLAQYPICINPFYSDRAIFEAMKPLLKAIRKKLEIESDTALTSQELEKWCDNGLLPYFDLRLWELAAKRKITYRVMADAIYPSTTRFGEETIRKTLHPLYLRFLKRNDFEKAGTHSELSIRDQLRYFAHEVNPDASYF